MNALIAIVTVTLSTAALADGVAPSASGQTSQPVKAACTPPDELIVKLPFAKAVTLNNILQDVDVGHKEWTDVAMDVRAQLVGQCKENKK